ncbi:nitroreductase family protein [Glycomyces tenuis]|uniref:nitroreductase family protein n=1 Tax=Glycomyces tenuis TaxID=58116 RepID=UPI000426E387|nr:nitroreductase family protein [Glycomyces tenuis]
MPIFAEDEPAAAVRSMMWSRQGAAARPQRRTIAADAGTPLREALRRRRSHREYTNAPVPAALIDLVLSTALQTHRAQWGALDDEGAALGPYLLVREGRGRDPLYRVRSGLERIRAQDTGKLACALAEHYAAAPVMLLITGPAGPGAAHRYGDLLTRAGALGHAFWMAAVGFGLDGCMFGKACSEFTGFLRRGGRDARHLLTVTIGYGTAPSTESA